MIPSGRALLRLFNASCEEVLHNDVMGKKLSFTPKLCLNCIKAVAKGL